jgi:hypothetical protein
MARIKDLRQPAIQEVISVINDSKNVISYKYLLDNCFFLAESFRHGCGDFYFHNFINSTYSYVS